MAQARGAPMRTGAAPGAGPAPLPLATAALLAAADASNSIDYYRRIADLLNRHAPAYSVDTPLRLAHFLAQVAHESAFRPAEENGNYTARQMRELFGCKGGPAGYDSRRDDCLAGPGGRPARLRPKLWTLEATYANNARNLLGYVHALRLGNGDEVSGDGYRYRGRGLLALAGKDEYRSFTDCHNTRTPGEQRDFVAHPDLLVTELDCAIESAFYVWEARDANLPADQDDIVEVTRRIAGGLDGLDDRARRLAGIKAAMGI